MLQLKIMHSKQDPKRSRLDNKMKKVARKRKKTLVKTWA
jgi:hypothetical protein